MSKGIILTILFYFLYSQMGSASISFYKIGKNTTGIDSNYDGVTDYQVVNKGTGVSETYYGRKFDHLQRIERKNDRTIFSYWVKKSGKWLLLKQRTISDVSEGYMRVTIKKRTSPNQYVTSKYFQKSSGFFQSMTQINQLDQLWINYKFQKYENMLYGACIPDIVNTWFKNPTQLISSVAQSLGENYLDEIKNYLNFEGCSESSKRMALEGLREGLSCLEGMSRDGPGIAAQMLGILVNGPEISRPPGNKVKVRCGDFATSDFSSEGYSTNNSAEVKPPCSSGYPEVGINTNPNVARADPGLTKATFFHEFLHLTGRGHHAGQVDTTYMCQLACFSDELPIPESLAAIGGPERPLRSSVDENDTVLSSKEAYQAQAESYCDGTNTTTWDAAYTNTLGAVTTAVAGEPIALLMQLVDSPTIDRVNHAYFTMQEIGEPTFRNNVYGNANFVVPALGVGDTTNEIIRLIYTVWVEDNPDSSDEVERVEGVPNFDIITESQFSNLRAAIGNINNTESLSDRLTGYGQLTKLIEGISNRNQNIQQEIESGSLTGDTLNRAIKRKKYTTDVMRTLTRILRVNCIRDKREASGDDVMMMEADDVMMMEVKRACTGF